MSHTRVQAPLGRREAIVTAREEHGPYVVLRVTDPAGPRPAAGQFYMLAACAGWGGGVGERPFLPRALSVMRAPTAGSELQFMLEVVGPGTMRLCALAAGESVWLLGPLGNGFRVPRDGRRPVLIGGGVGAAPLAILQDELMGEPTGDPPATLLGFRDAHHARGAGLLSAARIATDDGSAGHHGVVTDLLADELRLDAHAEVYACGPPAMLEAVRMMCAQRDVPGQLALESGMACGYGACFGCVVQTRDGFIRLCVDGPVTELDRLESVLAGGVTG